MVVGRPSGRGRGGAVDQTCAGRERSRRWRETDGGNRVNGRKLKTQLSVLWLAYDEVSFYGLPPLLDRVSTVGTHTVCLEMAEFEVHLRERSRDVCVFPLALYEPMAKLLKERKGTSVALTVSESSAPVAARLVEAGSVDAWLLERRITVQHVVQEFGRMSQAAVTGGTVAGRPIPVLEERDASTARRVTVREQCVLQLLSSGQSNQLIAQSLGISIHGVKRHVSNLLIKLNCANRTQLALVSESVLGASEQG